MNKKLYGLIGLIIVLVAVGTAVVLSRKSDVTVTPTPSPSVTPTPTSTPTVTPSAKPKTTAAASTATTGTLEGASAYPGETYPPGMQVCAEETTTKKVSCTTIIDTDHLLSYKLSVPAGTYHVYTEPPGKPNFRGYYSTGVTCEREKSSKPGYTSDQCADRKILSVTVKSGETLTKIDATDFYGPWDS